MAYRQQRIIAPWRGLLTLDILCGCISSGAAATTVAARSYKNSDSKPNVEDDKFANSRRRVTASMSLVAAAESFGYESPAGNRLKDTVAKGGVRASVAADIEGGSDTWTEISPDMVEMAGGEEIVFAVRQDALQAKARTEF
eukprot:gnl/MRDRNA2_/MRDRNA2_66183_c0_seq2.p4 gnl/MRDRNA2_/MRDRNA2_66183_c0~~gnl/MRDRNA2_/MRDRNA2_66183_c0_seq2.p4  ORF type:complete len:141 (+),score=32.18 gnl/MRDRNA2_/MRDRNA2_66183_c0_seq2:31-453(+)